MVCAGEEGKVIDIMDDLMIQQEHDKGARKKKLALLAEHSSERGGGSDP